MTADKVNRGTSAAAQALARCIALTVLVVGWLQGCAVNPVTGQTEFVLMSEDEEISIGRKLHPQVLAQMHGYEDEALQGYVQNIGQRLAAHSHRPGLIYRFTVVDSPDVNAFALPGGYIYITRGLLAYLNSEAELAAVLGHEIGHVTARHSVRQYTTAATTGLLGGVIASQIGVQGAFDLANILGTAIVRGYGRDHELEADRLGAEYLARSGYNPRAMIEVIGVLKNQEEFEQQLAREEDRDPRVYHGVFSTHPDNDRRLQEVVQAAQPLMQAGASGVVGRHEFVQRVDGLVFGDSVREGIRRGNHFYHPELGFALAFPSGWAIDNLPDRLLAGAPGRQAEMMMTAQDLNRRIPPRDFIVQRLKVTDVREGRAFSTDELEGYTGLTTLPTDHGRRTARLIVLYFRDRAIVFAGVTRDVGAFAQHDPRFLETAASFHAITEAERKQAQPQRIRFVRAGTHTDWKDLAQRSPITAHPEEQLRLLNGLYPAGNPVPGQSLKIVE